MTSANQEPEMEPVPGAPSDNTTALAEIEELRAKGYGADFIVREGGTVCCRKCDHCEQPEALDVDVFRRLEGASDPDDMSAILALTCRECGTKGIAMVAYGPHASADEGELLRRVSTPQDEGTSGAV